MTKITAALQKETNTVVQAELQEKLLSLQKMEQAAVRELHVQEREARLRNDTVKKLVAMHVELNGAIRRDMDNRGGIAASLVQQQALQDEIKRYLEERKKIYLAAPAVPAPTQRRLSTN